MVASVKPSRAFTCATSWDPVAEWYVGWVGRKGSRHHRALAIPAVLELLDPAPGEAILDVGAGPGALAPAIAGAGALYTGVDASERLIRFARRWHGHEGRFVRADARRLPDVAELRPASFDGAVFLLSIQDMEPLDAVLRSVAWGLKPWGRLVLLMLHPCFRVPRQSGWGWDQERRLLFRRVDRYLTPLPVPMKAYRQGERRGTTWSFHRPLEAYVNALAACGLLVERLQEIVADDAGRVGPRARAEHLARQEIPLFLGLRARKVGAESLPRGT